MLNTLCLLWQDTKTRMWFHVGNLTQNANGSYTFSYELENKKRNLEKAIEYGYKLHPTFPNKNEVYTSEFLFSAFRRRLPDRKRKDFLEVLHNLGSSISTDFEVLEFTGGSLNSDSYEFVRPVQFDNDKFELEFYLRGWRYYGKDDSVESTDRLKLEIEEDCEFDTDAVCVLKNSDKKIGYVPAFYSDFIKTILTDSCSNLDEVEFEFNALAPSHYKLKLKVNGVVSEDTLRKFDKSLLLCC